MGIRKGKCSAKIVDTLVPQTITNNTKSFTIVMESIKFKKNHPAPTLPFQATTGSTAYNLFPLKKIHIPPMAQKSISTGLSCKMPPTIYGQVTSWSRMSFKHQINIVTGIINSNYQGNINVLLHNHSEHSYELDPKRAMAQLLFVPISQLSIMETNILSQTECSSRGFGSTNCTTMISNTIQLKTVAGQPPGATILGMHLSKATINLNSLNGLISQVIIDSGSNISLISSKLLERFDPPLKLKEGQDIKINQVTRQSSTNHTYH